MELKTGETLTVRTPNGDIVIRVMDTAAGTEPRSLTTVEIEPGERNAMKRGTKYNSIQQK